jgi:hypothetical protein
MSDATQAPPDPHAGRPFLRMYHGWRLRHQHPFNFAIHLLGIPLAVAGVVLLFALPWAQWYWGVGAFVLGYLFQYLGHLVEGNDLGEWAGIKRLLGLPYVGIAPQYAQAALPPKQLDPATSANASATPVCQRSSQPEGGRPRL